jgi:hypothetical protein
MRGRRQQAVHPGRDPGGCHALVQAGAGPAGGDLPASVYRIWRSFGLQPWRTEDFKISPGPLLTGKIRDVIGLYLAPPANAAVFAVDEKPQIQALQRTAPVLPMIPGCPSGAAMTTSGTAPWTCSPR